MKKLSTTFNISIGTLLAWFACALIGVTITALLTVCADASEIVKVTPDQEIVMIPITIKETKPIRSVSVSDIGVENQWYEESTYVAYVVINFILVAIVIAASFINGRKPYEEDGLFHK